MSKRNLKLFGIGAAVLMFVLVFAPLGSATPNDNKGKDNYSLSCFPAGTRIIMADGSYKNIEDIHVGDRVLSYDVQHNRFTSWTIKMTASPLHSLIEINDGLLYLTVDHPLRIQKVDGTTGWGAIDPVRGKEATRIGNAILKIEVRDKVFTKDGNWIDITKITVHPESTQTYDILSFSGRHSYFANGILAYEENPFFYPIWMNLILDKILERYPNAFPILGYLLGR